MTPEEFSVSLQRTEDRAKSNTRRIEHLEEQNHLLQTLANSVAVMTEKLGALNATVEKVEEKVEHLEAKPAHRAEKIMTKVLEVLISALAGFLLAQLGL